MDAMIQLTLFKAISGQPFIFAIFLSLIFFFKFNFIKQKNIKYNKLIHSFHLILSLTKKIY